MNSLNDLITRFKASGERPLVVRQPAGPAGNVSDLGCGRAAGVARPPSAISGKVFIVVTGQATVNCDLLPDDVVDEIKKAFTVKNPAYQKAVRFGGRGDYIPEPHLHAFELDDARHISIPRASLRWLMDLLQSRGARIELVDQTVSAPAEQSIIPADSQDSDVHEAVGCLSGKRFGVYVGPWGDGCSAACRLIAVRGERTLIVVKQRHQLYQWRDELCRQTSLTPADIGLAGDGNAISGSPAVMVAIDKSLWKCLDNLPPIGQVVIDRCDLANMKIFFKVAWGMPARYILGIATGKRDDGLDGMMLAFCGPVRYTKTTPFVLPELRPTVEVRPYNGVYDLSEYDPALERLLGDDDRTRMIADDVVKLAASGSAVVVVSVRRKHLDVIRDFIQAQYRETEIITGRAKPHQAERIAAEFNAGKFPVLLTTTKSIGSIKIDRRHNLAAVVAAPFTYRDTASSLSICLPDGDGAHPPGRLIEYRDECGFFKASLARRLYFYRQLGFNVPEM